MTTYRKEIEAAARARDLDPDLVEAIVATESSYRTDAFRHEPAFWRRYMSRDSRWKDANPRRVSSSYGLMQVMYFVALERGYPPQSPPEGLFVPGTGLQFGCRQLKFLFDSEEDWADEIEAVLAQYNGGRRGNRANKVKGDERNAAYAAKVLSAYHSIRAV